MSVEKREFCIVHPQNKVSDKSSSLCEVCISNILTADYRPRPKVPPLPKNVCATCFYSKKSCECGAHGV